MDRKPTIVRMDYMFIRKNLKASIGGEIDEKYVSLRQIEAVTGINFMERRGNLVRWGRPTDMDRTTETYFFLFIRGYLV